MNEDQVLNRRMVAYRPEPAMLDRLQRSADINGRALAREVEVRVAASFEPAAGVHTVAVRQRCLDHAMQACQGPDVERVVEFARSLEQYVLGVEPPAAPLRSAA